jgi:hypothetical protein
MIHTSVVWNKNSITIELTEAVNSKVSTMVEEHLTDGSSDITYLENNQQAVYRSWVTEEAANEWILFITQYNPVSVEIVDR